MRAHMSEVWGQAWMSVTPTGTGMNANGPMIEIVLLPISVRLLGSMLLLKSVLPLTSVLKNALLLASSLPIKNVMLTATSKIAALRTKKAPAGKSANHVFGILKLNNSQVPVLPVNSKTLRAGKVGSLYQV